MIAFVRGILKEIVQDSVVVDVGGIGYQLFVPPNLITQLPLLESEVFFYTTFVVRDVSHTLYGFLKTQEKALFERLITISGIGPKGAMKVVGNISTETFSQAIISGDLRTLTKIPGLGKKTAERLIVEMRDKLSRFPSYKSPDPVTSQLQDAMSALINLGYSQPVAKRALDKTLDQSEGNLDLPNLITQALKQL